GTYTFVIKATDANKVAATKSYTVKITQTAISGTFTATGVVKAKYNSAVTVSGGTASYTWTKASGTIPAGLKLTYSGAKATLSGTPTKAGSYTFSLKVTDKNGVAATKSYTVKITQTAISGTFANGVVKAKYTSTITVGGGTASYTWTKASGTLPAGLKLTYSGAKATLSGTPTKAGNYTFSLKVTDKNGVAATKSYTVKITQTAISGTFTATGIVKAKYNSTVTVGGGTAGYTWTKASGTLPAGLKLTYSGAKATLSGTPTKAGSYTFTIEVKDKNGVVATKKFTVKITEAKSATKSQPDVATARPEESPTSQTADKTLAEAVTAPISVKSALPGGGTGSVNLPATLSVFSEDIVEAYDGKDSDLVRVRENTPVRFIVSNWGTKVSSQVVYVDDKPAEGIRISDEGMFTLPSEFVRGDFKVCVKSQSESETLESEELFIIAE
ncbi:MAG: putative Ig domain-containing protein, partial [Synergistaceae bacterium]|nr:putative Ig domain-containing protein [Synergistaceae bacterium]